MSPDSRLTEAYELIKAGQRTQAGNILKNYLATQPDDADGWWLMAHAVTDPSAVQKCLEKVLEINPRHTRARDKLARMQAAQPITPAYDFVMPDDLAPAAELPPARHDPLDWGGIMAGRLGSDNAEFTTSSDIFGSPGRALNLPEPATVRPQQANLRRYEVGSHRNRNTLIGLALIVVAVVVVAGLLIYKAAEEGWIGKTEQTVPGAISTHNYTIKFPDTWMSECSSGLLWMQEVCAFSMDEKYSLLDLYTSGRDDIGSDALLDSVDYLFFEGGRQRPDLVVTGILLDYSQNSKDYEYIYQSILWYEQLYSSWLGRTNYIQGYDLYMRYEKQNPEIHGETSYIYWISGKDAIGILMTGRGYFLICDAFIPHGDRMLMMEVVAYSTTSLETIPRREIEQMIESVAFDG